MFLNSGSGEAAHEGRPRSHPEVGVRPRDRGCPHHGRRELPRRKNAGNAACRGFTGMTGLSG